MSTVGEPTAFVFDTGPLSHFAQAGWLGLLEMYVDHKSAWLPETVRREIGDAVDTHPHLRGVLEAEWLDYRSITSGPEQDAFANYSFQLLGASNENLGECGVLALAQTHGAFAVIDDGSARRIGEDNGVLIKTTVAILCDLVNTQAISLDTAATVADRLLMTTYRLPFQPGEFKTFVLQKDLIQDPYGVGI